MVEVEKVTMGVDHKVGDVVSDTMFESLGQIGYDVNASIRTIGGVPREGHFVDNHWEASDVGCAKAGINEKFSGATADDFDGVGGQLIIVTSLIQRHKVNVATGKSVKIGLGELNNE
jgi:hypothetical protein